MTDQSDWTIERKEQLSRLRKLLTHLASPKAGRLADEADSLLYDRSSFILFLYDLAGAKNGKE